MSEIPRENEEGKNDEAPEGILHWKDPNLEDTQIVDIPEQSEGPYGPKDYHIEILDRGREKIKALKEKIADLKKQRESLVDKLGEENIDRDKIEEEIKEIFTEEDELKKEMYEVEGQTRKDLKEHFNQKREK